MRKPAVLTGSAVVVIVVVTGVTIALTTGGKPPARWVQAVPVDAVVPGASPPVVASPSVSGSPSPSRSASAGPAGGGRCQGFPNAGCTGVPAGTALASYSGPCTITAANAVIHGKLVTCDLDIKAAGVVIEASKINGLVYLDTDDARSGKWSFTLRDSEVDGGHQQRASVSAGNMTVLRSNIHGGITAVQCEEKSLSCTVQDSWLHGQYIPPGSDWHLGGFLSDGGRNIKLIHNNVVCDHAVTSAGGGCTGDINFIPNFAPISGALVQNNFLGANVDAAYSTYGGEKSTSQFPHSDHIVYRDNVFQRGPNRKGCAYGPVTSFNGHGPGNQWINNKWEDGAPVPPEN